MKLLAKGKSLSDLDARLQGARAALEGAEALVEQAEETAERELGEAAEALALGELDATGYDSISDVHDATIAALRKVADREKVVVDTLRSRCASLARADADAKQNIAQTNITMIETRITELETELDERRSELVDAEDALAVVRHETGFADAAYDASSRRAAEETRRSQWDIIKWHAHHWPRDPDRWPVALRPQIRELVARLTAESEERQRDLAARSRASLEAAGFSEADAAALSGGSGSG